MKILLALALLTAWSPSARADEDPCKKYLTAAHQREIFMPAWTKRATPQAKRFLASYAKGEKAEVALEMQCLITVGLERVIKNENDTAVDWARDHKNIRPSKGQEDVDAATKAMVDFRARRDPNAMSASDKAKLSALQERVRAAQAQLSRFKGLCNEWTQSVCSSFVFPARHHVVRWVEIHWPGLEANEATHNMVAICAKDAAENPFAHRGRCLLIDAWRNLDADHDVYWFAEYQNMGDSRSQKTCPDGKNL